MTGESHGYRWWFAGEAHCYCGRRFESVQALEQHVNPTPAPVADETTDAGVGEHVQFTDETGTWCRKECPRSMAECGALAVQQNDHFAEPDVGDDVDALAKLLSGVKDDDEWLGMSAWDQSAAEANAERILASDWLDAVRRKAADEAHEKGYWVGYREGKDEAETRDLNYDEMTAAIERVRAVADEWERLSKGSTATTRRIREALEP